MERLPVTSTDPDHLDERAVESPASTADETDEHTPVAVRAEDE